jgi:hypothetical protein
MEIKFSDHTRICCRAEDRTRYVSLQASRRREGQQEKKRIAQTWCGTYLHISPSAIP